MTDLDDAAGESAVTLLRGSVSPAFERAVHVVECGEPLRCGEAWRDVFAIVEFGAVELETATGTTLLLTQGDSFCLAGVGPIVLRSAGTDPAVIATVRRCAPGGSFHA